MLRTTVCRNGQTTAESSCGFCGVGDNDAAKLSPINTNQAPIGQVGRLLINLDASTLKQIVARRQHQQLLQKGASNGGRCRIFEKPTG